MASAISFAVALTEFVLSHWGEDDVVFSSFSATTHNLEAYFGDISKAHRNHAELARQFLSNATPAIRRWAEAEVANEEAEAKAWQVRLRDTHLSVEYKRQGRCRIAAVWGDPRIRVTTNFTTSRKGECDKFR